MLRVAQIATATTTKAKETRVCTARQEEYKKAAGREDREHLCASVKTVPCPNVSLYFVITDSPEEGEPPHLH